MQAVPYSLPSSQVDYSYVLGDRNRLYKRTWDAGQKIGRWAKRKWDQRKARQGKTAAKRAVSRPFIGHQVEAGGGSGESQSFTRYGSIKKVPLGGVYQAIGNSVVRRTTSLTTTCGQGVQVASLISSHLDATDITNLFSSFGQTAAGFASAKMIVKTIRAENMITNSSSLHIHCTIYECIARFDGFTTVNTNPVTVFTQGGVDAQGGAAADATVVGTSPFDIPRLTAAYNIIKVTPLILASGQTHNHTILYNVNKAVERERVTLNGVGPVGGLTLYCFVVFHGTPVHDLSTEAIISTGVGKIDVVTKEGVYFTQVSQPGAINSVSSTLVTNITSPEQWAEEVPADTLNVV